MPLYWVVLLVCVLMPVTGNDQFPNLERPWMGAIACVVCWGLIAKGLACFHASRVLTRRADLHSSSERFSKSVHHLRWLWIPVGAFGLTACGWAEQVGTLVPRSFASLTACLLVLPSLMAIATTWIAEFQYREWAESTLSQSASSCSDRPVRLPLVDAVTERFRLQAGWILLPVLCVLAVVDATNLVFSNLITSAVSADMFGSNGANDLSADHSLSSIQTTWMAGAIGLLTLPLLLPKLITTAWTTSRCGDDPRTTWICEVVRSAGYPRLEVRRWDTGHRICTAMIAGVVPGFRVLLLSDGLLARLDRPTTIMVVLHELAHVARRHMRCGWRRSSRFGPSPPGYPFRSPQRRLNVPYAWVWGY
ncbi:MAG: hypothetical protein R3C05_07050 [Pirellulaceae bacterium]